MAKRKRYLATTVYRLLEPLRTRCEGCGGPLWSAYHNTRTVATLDGLVHLTAKIRRCETRTCALFHQPYRPQEEGGGRSPMASSASTSLPGSGASATRRIGRSRSSIKRSAPAESLSP